LSVPLCPVRSHWGETVVVSQAGWGAWSSWTQLVPGGPSHPLPVPQFPHSSADPPLPAVLHGSLLRQSPHLHEGPFPHGREGVAHPGAAAAGEDGRHVHPHRGGRDSRRLGGHLPRPVPGHGWVHVGGTHRAPGHPSYPPLGPRQNPKPRVPRSGGFPAQSGGAARGSPHRGEHPALRDTGAGEEPTAGPTEGTDGVGG